MMVNVCILIHLAYFEENSEPKHLKIALKSVAQ